jgi:hypothetical protein
MARLQALAADISLASKIAKGKHSSLFFHTLVTIKRHFITLIPGDYWPEEFKRNSRHSLDISPVKKLARSGLYNFLSIFMKQPYLYLEHVQD